jgi:hypothetical protein
VSEGTAENAGSAITAVPVRMFEFIVTGQPFSLMLKKHLLLKKTVHCSLLMSILIIWKIWK